MTKTAKVLTSGDISTAHAAALAHGTRALPAQVAAEAEPTLLLAARRLDPPGLWRLADHLRDSLDPKSADTRAQRQHERRGCGRPPPSRAWSPARGCWTQKPARSCWPRWSRWPARPAPTTPQRDQRRADALTELARRTLEAGQLPQSGGVRPQLLVTVDLDSLVGRPGAVGVRWAGWARWPPRRVGDSPATGR